MIKDILGLAALFILTITLLLLGPGLEGDPNFNDERKIYEQR